MDAADVSDVSDVGRWLAEQRAGLDRAEAEWLARLAEFDRLGLWALDGQFSCIGWLVCHTNMARSTAFEKLRVAHQLRRRPVIADAFFAGRLSYSAVRALTRLPDPSAEVDQALVDLAASGRASIVDLERAVRAYLLYADQERPPLEDPTRYRDVRIHRGDNGTGQVILTLSDLEVEEFAAALQAFLDRRDRRPAVDRPVAAAAGGAPVSGVVEESSDGDTCSAREAPLERVGRGAERVDALMDLVHAALAAADDGRAAGDDRYLVHLVSHVTDPAVTFLDGRPLHPTDADVVACDHSSITHTTGPTAEPLSVGRKTRYWSIAQRRAVSIRDGGRCRFIGCTHTRCDLHHLRPWHAGGATDVDNAATTCRRHHRMLHSGYRVEGDPNGELRFYRPDGTYIGATRPVHATGIVPYFDDARVEAKICQARRLLATKESVT